MKALFFFLLSCSIALGQFDLPAVIYGNVSGGSGAVINSPSASIVIYRDGSEVGRAVLEINGTENYRVEIPGPSGFAEYTAKLERSGVKSSLLLLSPGPVPFKLTTEDVKRLDFIVGDDGDLDGIPDEWEEFQLGYIGIFRGDPDFSLDTLKPDGDYDFDGLSDGAEFIAGTLATSFESRVNFKLLGERDDGRIDAAFDAVKGRIYELRSSTNLSLWNPVQILVQGLSTTSFQATITGRLNFIIPANAAEGVFYQMSVK